MVEYPYPIWVPIPTREQCSSQPHPRYEWAVETIGEDNFCINEKDSVVIYWFKHESDATMFALKWK